MYARREDERKQVEVEQDARRGTIRTSDDGMGKVGGSMLHTYITAETSQCEDVLQAAQRGDAPSEPACHRQRQFRF